MSSILIIILYYLTDGLAAESFSRKKTVYFLHLSVIGTAQVIPFFPDQAAHRLLLAALLTAQLKGETNLFFTDSLLKQSRTDFLSALCPLSASHVILGIPGVVQISERPHVFDGSVHRIRRIEPLPELFPQGGLCPVHIA